MELLVTLRKMEDLEKFAEVADGLIVGSEYTTAFHLKQKDRSRINEYLKSKEKKIYVMMDNFIMEDEKKDVSDYLDYLKSLEINGLYFHDLGIFGMARTKQFGKDLIYDGKSVLCNSLDSAFLLKTGINAVVLSRELTLKEVKDIVNANPGRIDLQIFGHLRLSVSRRKFLSNYFKEIKKDYRYFAKETLSLIEEQRDYRLPIIEDGNGTSIFSDYILEMFDELPELQSKLNHGIVDSLFINDSDLIVDLCHEYKRLSADNKDFIKDSFMRKHPADYSQGYLYQKTNITKDE